MRLFFIVLLLTFSTLFAVGTTQKYPVSFVNVILANQDYKNIIIVEKNDQKAYLYDLSSNPLDIGLVAKFNISTGKQYGAKDKQGDLKTPQGFYNITRYIPGRQLDSMYGVGAFPLDYPNELDRRLGKSGGGIWLHGTDKQDFIPFDTEGCIRFENEDLERIKNFINIGKTPVLVKDEIDWLTYEEINLLITDFKKRMEDWRLAWESNDVSDYMQYYHPDFYEPNQNMNILRWADYKHRISVGKSIISVNLSNMEYYFFDKYFLVRAEQDYRSDDYSDFGRKTLLWIIEDGEWYILQEDWTALRRRSR